MSANTETTGAPEGYVPCPAKCGRWTPRDCYDAVQTYCWRCLGELPGSPLDRKDWSPPIAAPAFEHQALCPVERGGSCNCVPIAAPAARVERRKGQRWRRQWRDMTEEVTLLDRSTWTHQPGWNVAPGVALHDACWTDPSLGNTMTLLADATPEPAKCPANATGNPVDCGGCPEHASPPAQEAPKAAPVCTNGRNCLAPGAPVLMRVLRRERQPMCDRCYLDAEENLGIMMRGESTGKPYAGPERLPRPQLAADWVEDCLPTVWR